MTLETETTKRVTFQKLFKYIGCPIDNSSLGKSKNRKKGDQELTIID